MKELQISISIPLLTLKFVNTKIKNKQNLRDLLKKWLTERKTNDKLMSRTAQRDFCTFYRFYKLNEII